MSADFLKYENKSDHYILAFKYTAYAECKVKFKQPCA